MGRRGNRHAGSTWPRRLGLALAATVLALVSAEAIARWLWPVPEPEPALARRCGACPQVYQLDTASPEVGPQGLRDRAYPIPRVAAAPRILVLGDSVVHGGDVPAAARFTERLEAALTAQIPETEVINAGVPGYSTYNERAWYESEGRAFAADLVLLGVCLNDVVDPLLHWNCLNHPWSEHAVADAAIPAGAVPNPLYHREEVLAPLQRHRGRLWLHESSALYRRFGVVSGWSGPLGAGGRPHSRSMAVAGRTWSVQLTGEDELPITVWTDEGSPEWAWFQEQLDALTAAIEGDGGRLALVVFPLAYQLDPEYPFSPQERITGHAAARDLPCLDLLPVLRGAREREPFLPEDDWHLSATGHAVVADALEDFVAPLLEGDPAGVDQSVSKGIGIRSEE